MASRWFSRSKDGLDRRAEDSRGAVSQGSRAVVVWGGLAGVPDVVGGEDEFALTSPAPLVVLVGLEDLSRLDEARREHPGASVLVWDRRDACSPAEIAAGLDRGADGYVVGMDRTVLAAHLRSMLRRHGAVLMDFPTSGST